MSRFIDALALRRCRVDADALARLNARADQTPARSALAFRAIAACALALAAPGLAAASPGLGRAATPQELAAWDTAVRADFKGLPKGSGSVAQGQLIWDGRCASCHGTFGESNEVFTPIVGGTTEDDIKTGHVAALTSRTQPHKTTLMKLATVSTLWDYIRRAMPWTAPKSLSTDEVYAVTAYILNLGAIVPDDFTLTDANIADVQKRMPNRNGMSRAHGLWDVTGKPDVHSVACMKDCPVGNQIRSSLPDAARNSQGNLAQQNRGIGASHAVDTSRPKATSPLAARDLAQGAADASAGMPASPSPDAHAVASSTARPPSPPAGAAWALQPSPNGSASTAAAPSSDVATPSAATDQLGNALAAKYACLSCHGVSARIVGPGFAEVAVKYQGQAGAPAALAAKVKLGGAGNWGAIPMPPQAQVPEEELRTLIGWILGRTK